MNPDLTLYDLAGADASLRFSPHCWKIHMALAHRLSAATVPWRFTDKEEIAFSGQKLVPVLLHDGGGQRFLADRLPPGRRLSRPPRCSAARPAAS